MTLRRRRMRLIFAIVCLVVSVALIVTEFSLNLEFYRERNVVGQDGAGTDIMQGSFLDESQRTTSIALLVTALVLGAITIVMIAVMLLKYLRRKQQEDEQLLAEAEQEIIADEVGSGA